MYKRQAIIVTPDADLKMTIMGTVFGAVGTCGQRCTSTRRLIVHEKVYEKVIKKIDNTKYSNIIYGQNFSTGVLGIVASRLIEKSYKPDSVKS